MSWACRLSHVTRLGLSCFALLCYVRDTHKAHRGPAPDSPRIATRHSHHARPCEVVLAGTLGGRRARLGLVQRQGVQVELLLDRTLRKRIKAWDEFVKVVRRCSGTPTRQPNHAHPCPPLTCILVK